MFKGMHIAFSPGCHCLPDAPPYPPTPLPRAMPPSSPGFKTGVWCYSSRLADHLSADLCRVLCAFSLLLLLPPFPGPPPSHFFPPCLLKFSFRVPAGCSITAPPAACFPLLICLGFLLRLSDSHRFWGRHLDKFKTSMQPVLSFPFLLVRSPR